jgi:hypothetical protein
MNFAIGFLVAIEARDEGLIMARMLGRVAVKQLPPELMSWEALKWLKGSVLPAEMNAGLLTRAWNRRLRLAADFPPYIAPGTVLDTMPRPWPRQGSALDYELDHIFAGCKPIASSQCWYVHGLDDKQISESKLRAPNQILDEPEREQDPSFLPTMLIDEPHDGRRILAVFRRWFLGKSQTVNISAIEAMATS